MSWRPEWFLVPACLLMSDPIDATVLTMSPRSAYSRARFLHHARCSARPSVTSSVSGMVGVLLVGVWCGLDSASEDRQARVAVGLDPVGKLAQHTSARISGETGSRLTGAAYRALPVAKPDLGHLVTGHRTAAGTEAHAVAQLDADPVGIEGHHASVWSLRGWVSGTAGCSPRSRSANERNPLSASVGVAPV